MFLVVLSVDWFWEEVVFWRSRGDFFFGFVWLFLERVVSFLGKYSIEY